MKMRFLPSLIPLASLTTLTLSASSMLLSGCAEVPVKSEGWSAIHDENAGKQPTENSSQPSADVVHSADEKNDAIPSEKSEKNAELSAEEPSETSSSETSSEEPSSDNLTAGASTGESTGESTTPESEKSTNGISQSDGKSSTGNDVSTTKSDGSSEANAQAFDKAVQAALLPSSDLASLKDQFQQLATDDPKSASAHYNLALVSERQGDLPGAEAAYVKCLNLNRNMKAAALNLAKLYLRQGKATEGERMLREMLKEGESSAGILGALALIEVETNQIEEAIADARASLKLDEMDVSTMVTLARAYSAQNRLELASLVLGNAIGIAPDSPMIANQLGILLLRQDKKQAARNYFKQAAEAQPDFPEAHANYGGSLLASQNFGEAVEHLELALKFAPDLSIAKVNLASAYRGLGDFQKANELYLQALKEAPELEADIRFNLGILFLDGQNTGMPLLEQLHQAEEYLKSSEEIRHDELISEYLKVAKKRIGKEEKRLAREEKKRQKEEAEKRRKAEEEAAKAAEAAAAEAAKAAEAAETETETTSTEPSDTSDADTSDADTSDAAPSTIADKAVPSTDSKESATSTTSLIDASEDSSDLTQSEEASNRFESDEGQ